jgi:hypothetical protein
VFLNNKAILPEAVTEPAGGLNGVFVGDKQYSSRKSIIKQYPSRPACQSFAYFRRVCVKAVLPAAGQFSFN